jgi:ATP-binding cassette, subfamily B (MDR/TAP), member 1
MATLESHKDDGKSSKWKIMLNPFRCFQAYGTSKTPGASYFALFRPLHDGQSRLILFGGVVLAIAAGAPLPIIGQSNFSKYMPSFLSASNSVSMSNSF